MGTQSDVNQDKRYQQNIAAELVYLLYSQATPAIIGSLFVACCLAFSLIHVVTPYKLYSWFSLMLVISAVRFTVIRLYLRVRPPVEDCSFWSKIFITMAAISGITWSLVGSVLMPASPIHQTFIAFALAGVAAGAIPFFSGSRAACNAFVIPTLTPFAIWCFLQGDVLHETLGGLTISFLLLLIISGKRTNTVIYDAIKLKFKNDELVTNLTTTQDQMSEINSKLRHEVNDRKHAEELLRESEEQYRLVTDALPVMIAYIDTHLIFRFNNKAFESWFNKPLEQITGKSIKKLFNPTTYSVFIENYEKIKDKPHTFETIVEVLGQDERYLSVTMIPHIKDGIMQGMFTLLSDMTPRINYLATHDALTDLPNRSLFNSRFSQALKHAQVNKTEVALLFMDLDNFKNINDTLGHDIGDMLLISVAERVKKQLRANDTLARLGGDEFTIVLEDLENDDLISTITRVSKCFSEPFVLTNHEVFITTSIGISVYPDDGTDMQILIKNADMAIYRAKDQGKNTFEFFTPSMNDRILRKITLETNLRTALDNGEMKMFYQPIIDIETNKITSLEALARWDSFKLGSITPAEFIPVAEESGLIVPLGEWILRTVAQQNLDWQKSAAFPVKLRVAINLSSRQFKDTKLVYSIAQTLTEIGLSGEYLTLELTESLIMHDIDSNIKVLNKLKDLGISISIDDFGTGYSSLNYLRRFPIDVIKIDRSFITDITHENANDAAAIVTAIIAMSHSLKMGVVAEGVETIQQYNFLRDLGCDQIQGYLISKAVPVPEITMFLQRAFSYENYIKFRRFDKDYADKRWQEANSAQG
jgi:diguanylate cyclase (GGDEF)-like protein/PAS domain S-box-containing protein